MYRVCPALTGTAAATVVLTECDHEVVISNPVAAVLYVKFDWTTGDTEVSATNFDTMVMAASVTRIPGRYTNMRVLCASSTSIGVMCF